MKHLLLVLVGSSPQIVTESIYAFYKQHKIMINKVVCVSTSFNINNISSSLLGDGNELGQIAKLVRDYDLPEIEFDSDDILVPQTSDGDLIEDVKSEAEMAAMSEYILNLVQQLTNNSNIALHASLAGGRKTMTFFLSYAMSIFGRKQDTLTHVFVAPEYEHSEFYYPTPYNQLLDSREGRVNSEDAVVELAHIPYVQLRGNIPQKLLTQRVTVADTEEIYKTINAPVSLQLDPIKKRIICSGKAIQLSAVNFCFYSLMVDDALNANEGFDSPIEGSPDQTMALLYFNKRLYIEQSKQHFTELSSAAKYIDDNVMSIPASEIEGLVTGMKKSFFNQRKNEINKAIRAELPQVVAEHYDIDSISSTRRNGSSKRINFYGLQIDPNLINEINK